MAVRSKSQSGVVITSSLRRGLRSGESDHLQDDDSPPVPLKSVGIFLML